MRKATLKSLTDQIEAKKIRLAKLRDELRDLESEVSSLADDADEASDHLSYAVDALSRLV